MNAMETRPTDRELCEQFPEYRNTYTCAQLRLSDATSAFVAPIRARLLAMLDWIAEKTKRG